MVGSIPMVSYCVFQRVNNNDKKCGNKNKGTNEGFESRGVCYDIIAEIPCLVNQLFVKFMLIITRKAMDVKFYLKYLSKIINSRIQVHF